MPVLALAALVSTSAEASRTSGWSAAAAPQAAAALAPGAIASEARSVEHALALDDGALEESDAPSLALFAGDELDVQANATTPGFAPLEGVHLLDENLVARLATEDEPSYPKTRVRGFDFLGQEVVGVERELSLTLHWGSSVFGLGLASGSGEWLSEDPAGTVDSPSLYAFVGNRPNLATDPTGLMDPVTRDKLIEQQARGAKQVRDECPQGCMRPAYSESELRQAGLRDEAIGENNRIAARALLLYHVPEKVAIIGSLGAGAVARSNQIRAASQLNEYLPPRLSEPAKSAPLLTPQPGQPLSVYSDAAAPQGPFVVEQQLDPAPESPSPRKSSRYQRSKAARKAALLRDAADPATDLTPHERQQIVESRGKRVPQGLEVSHEQPLYTVPLRWRWILDVPENMKTQPEGEHRPRHAPGGDQFEKYGPPWLYPWY